MRFVYLHIHDVVLLCLICDS